MQSKLKVASLFCGCGGSDLGLIGGFSFLENEYPAHPLDIVYAIDSDTHAISTYNSNFSLPAKCADIYDEDFTQLKDVDLVVAGFPCQSFSTVNPTKDIYDDRANLYRQVTRFLREKRPKYFICENVKGLLVLKRGAIIERMAKEFANEGYDVSYQLLNSAHFGVPQKRERVFIVGVRNDQNINYEFPAPILEEKHFVPLGKVIDSLIPEDPKYYFSKRAVEGMKKAKNNMKRGLWQDLNKPCLTITAHLAKASINSRDPVLLVDPQKELYRRFTPREAARIQSFPDTFLLHKSDIQSYKQIGNAIPPILMWHVTQSLLDAIVK